jgi:Tol biopolymer transport system component
VQEAVRKIETRRAIIFLGVSITVLFLASGLLPTNPSAQTTSPEGKIVYEKLGDIWVMDADGTNRTNLTDTPDFLEYRASWAPSGAQLTFVRELEGEIISEQSDIFVMDADPVTDEAINLTQTDESEIDPDWSPDGAKIAFSGVRNSGFEIVRMDPDGQNETILSGDSFDGDDRAPDWSPDGTKVVFMKESQMGGCCEPWEIWAVNRDGSGDTNLTNHPSYDMGPSWSPDGTEIIFTSTRNRT